MRRNRKESKQSEILRLEHHTDVGFPIASSNNVSVNFLPSQIATQHVKFALDKKKFPANRTPYANSFQQYFNTCRPSTFQITQNLQIPPYRLHAKPFLTLALVHEHRFLYVFMSSCSLSITSSTFISKKNPFSSVYSSSTRLRVDHQVYFPNLSLTE